ncbi:odorant receptor 30a-like isoform X2 [Cylas formicarius]|uniref:odorant receptor 30a-like isoform X2 n=1 Tax=Cylas formicarius TaxID=197179 RepID=UPI002958A80E|nr:odorant receptor 30a-like isoform X2 [Cylas formicarius]
MWTSTRYFRYIRFLMMTVGIWRIQGEELSVIHKYLYQTYSMVFQLICSSAVVSLVVEIPTLLGKDTAAVMDNVGRLMIYFVIVFKMSMWQSKRMLRLLHIALQQDNEISHKSDEKVQQIYEWHVNYDNKVISAILVLAILIGICVAILGDIECYKFFKKSLRNNVTEKPLPLNLWYPFDRNKYYTWVLIDQNIRSTFSCLCIGVVGASVNSVVIFLKLQLKLLQYYFRYMGNCKARNILERNIAENNLKSLCIKHQRLIEYVQTFNKCVRNVILLEYTVSSLTFAIIILQITAGEPLIFNFTMLTYTAIQLLTFAWNCNEIIVQSLQLAISLYESKWYEQSKSAQQIIHIMMIRCQRPLYLRIGFLGVMNLEAGLSRLKLGYTYTSVMS